MLHGCFGYSNLGSMSLQFCWTNRNNVTPLWLANGESFINWLNFNSRVKTEVYLQPRDQGTLKPFVFLVQLTQTETRKRLSSPFLLTKQIFHSMFYFHWWMGLQCPLASDCLVCSISYKQKYLQQLKRQTRLQYYHRPYLY